MITPELRSRIRRLFFAEHWKIGTIAAELAVHRDTVEPHEIGSSAGADVAPVRPDAA